jgi:hypothetical protein
MEVYNPPVLKKITLKFLEINNFVKEYNELV